MAGIAQAMTATVASSPRATGERQWVASVHTKQQRLHRAREHPRHEDTERHADAVSTIPRDITIVTTLFAVAPKAIRKPISRLRADTDCASRPYRPMDAMSIASAPNATSSVVCCWRSTTVSDTTSDIDLISRTG